MESEKKERIYGQFVENTVIMYFVVDLEATCQENINKKDINEIIEIGVVACNDNSEIIFYWSSVIQPKLNKTLSKFCKKLTSINQYEINEAQNFNEVIENFISFCKTMNIDSSSCVWYTWGEWDLGCLIYDCERNKSSFPFGEHRDLRNIYIKKRNLSLSEKTGLQFIAKREGISHSSGFHRALFDAKIAAEIAKIIFTDDLKETP